MQIARESGKSGFRIQILFILETFLTTLCKTVGFLMLFSLLHLWLHYWLCVQTFLSLLLEAKMIDAVI